MTTKFVEPTNENAGQTVEVYEADSQTWKKRELVAVLPKDMSFRFVCRDIHAPTRAAYWSKARIEIPKTYAELQAESGLKVGDWVKVTKTAKNYENGWGVMWNITMDDYVGNTFQIYDICDIGILFEPRGYKFPYFVLEKTEKPETKEEKIDRLIRLFKEELVKIL